jgi:hypothetical protein
MGLDQASVRTAKAETMIWDNISVRMTYDTTIFPDEGAKTTYMV